MNTRREFVKAKPDRPSTKWHLMNEAYHPLFLPELYAHIEYWYNVGATGVQRDYFREICQEIYKQDGEKPDPVFPLAYTQLVRTEEATLMLKNFGETLTELGKKKSRVWILYESNSRRRDIFRDVFAGCQTTLKRLSTMKADYTPPSTDYSDMDRIHFHRNVDWTSLRGRKNIQKLAEMRAQTIANDNAIKLEGSPKPRFVKPKRQMEGVSVLNTFGYGDMPPEEAIAALKARRDAHQESEMYYVDTDGSTVYRAGVHHKSSASRRGDGYNFMVGVTSEPMSEWKVKVCD